MADESEAAKSGKRTFAMSAKGRFFPLGQRLEADLRQTDF